MSSVIASCVRLAGSTAAGILLYRLRFWTTRAKFEKGSYKWVVNTRDWWLEDTGLTRGSYDRAITALAQKGLIEHTNAGSPMNGGLGRYTWLRAVRTNEYDPTKKHQNGAGYGTDPMPPVAPEWCDPIIEHGDQQEIDMELGAAHAAKAGEEQAGSHPEALKSPPNPPANEAPMPKHTMADVAGIVAAKAAAVPKPKRGTAAAAYEVWRSAMIAGGFNFVVPSAMKMKVARDIEKKIGFDKWAKVCKAVGNWMAYVAWLHENNFWTGKGVPTSPDIMFVHKTIERALEFAHKDEAATVTPEGGKPFKQLF